MLINMEPIIELKNVSKRFGGITALDSASLHVDEGEVVGLIGDNGILKKQGKQKLKLFFKIELLLLNNQ